MKEIKFRAVIDGDEIRWSLVNMCGPHIFSMRSIICPWLLAGGVPDQFTGLKDKNGVEIYDGDICNDQHRCGQIFVAEWVYEKAMFSKHANFSPNVDFCLAEEAGKCEVIGNIHQNPELLEA